MSVIFPNYYKDFNCIASECRHSCCIGWEIDVDEISLHRYSQVGGALGRELSLNIIDDGCPHFKLTSEERCPFLNQQNLCRLILELGEGSLCQICSDHPRFRNEFCGNTEVGLGLCCEAAGTLILSQTEKVQFLTMPNFELLPVCSPFEQALFTLREKVFALIQDRSVPFCQRIQNISKEFDISFPHYANHQWADFFLSLEQLDSHWEKLLFQLKHSNAIPFNMDLVPFETSFEQLFIYFVYRHLASACNHADVKARLAFAILGCHIIYQLCTVLQATHPLHFDDLVDLARIYSSEIEYSEQNTDTILDLLRNAGTSSTKSASQ